MLIGAGASADPSAPAGGSPAAGSVAEKAGAKQAEQARQAKKAKKKRLKLTMLAINDFHGQLEVVPSTSSSGRINETPAGGGAYLATHLKQLRQQAKARGSRHLTVAAGDLIGATPLLSAAFYDEPTIEALNLMKLDIVSVGNHEFDAGYKQLLRLQRGGCVEDGDGENNKNSCPDPERPFEGADFRYLAANVKYAESGENVLPPYKIMKYGKKKKNRVKVGFIGMTLEDTPNIVTKAGVEGLTFHDEVQTVRELMPELRKKGVKSIVVLLHEGGVPSDPSQYNGCAGVTGPGYDIAEKLPAAIDVVVTGHTHQAYNCTVADPKGQPRLLTSASSVGRVVTEIRLAVNRNTKEIVRPRAKATNHIVTNTDTAPTQSVLDLIDRYKVFVEPIANRVIGQLDGRTSLTRTADANGGDSELGNLIADSQRSDPSTIPDGGETPVVALMNPGGIRADLIGNDEGEVTYGAAFTVQPFNNYVVSMTLTGQQLLDVLNEQWNGRNQSARKILQVSGLEYTWDESEAAQEQTDALVGDVLIDHDADAGTAMVPVDPNADYRVVVNSFLADGGDGFGTLAEGADRFFGGLDIDALANYLEANSPYAPTDTDRISTTP
jgi:5'-nucleotidase